MKIFAGVDGTGTGDQKKYAKEFKNSFVNTMGRTWTWPPLTFYERGPENLGTATKEIANRAAAWVIHMRAIWRSVYPKGIGVFMAGYSRGGVAVIDAAWTLKDSKIDVDCLLLFDAVDRTDTIPEHRTTIPPNVKFCYHARRDPHANSRPEFGNCGMKFVKPTVYKEKLFFCTHGGLGGVPWSKASKTGAIVEDYEVTNPITGRSDTTNVTLQLEKAGSKATGIWMNQALKKELAK